MLIDLKEIAHKYNLNIKGVCQIGAHWAEEHETYVELGIKNILYIEPCKDAFNILCSKEYMRNGINRYFSYKEASLILEYKSDSFLLQMSNILIFNCACGDEIIEQDMYVSNDNQGQSNSILKPHLHLKQHPEVRFTETEKVSVIPLDMLPFDRSNYNLLMMDVQGAEGLVLKGATETLKHIDCIYTEINRDFTYENNMLVEEMDEYLDNFGFTRTETKWASDNLSWGDAIYIKESEFDKALSDILKIADETKTDYSKKWYINK